MSQLKVDTITDEAGTGSPNFPNGIPGTASDATQTQATWEAGTSTTESIVSPAKVKAAIAAMAEGAVNAPRLMGYAAKRFADFPVLSVTASDAFSAAIGSNPVVGTTFTNSLNHVGAYTYTIEKYSGSLRFRASHRSFGTRTSTLRLLKNGSQIASFTTSSNFEVQRVVDASVDPTDVFVWTHRISNQDDTSVVSNFSITGSDGYTTRPLYLPFSEVDNP